MRQILGRFARGAALTVAAAFLGSGCVAFNVGEPETFTNRERIVETSPTPVRIEILSADAQLQPGGAEAVVCLGVAMQEEFEKREHTETVTVRKQKRLSIGLFPGAAEFMFVPRGALQPIFESGWARKTGEPSRGLYAYNPRNNMGKYVGFELVSVLSFGVLTSFQTVSSLLCAPFDDWRCGGHEFVDPTRIIQSGNVYDADSPKLRALLRFSKAERNRIGINTCFHQIDKSSDHGNAGHPFITHLGLVGIHKHLAVFVDGPTVGPSTVIGTETKRRSAFASGPFIAELSIPELGHNDWKRISSSDTRATFALPAVERDCTVEAVVSFREDNTANGLDASGFTRQALAKAAGRQWRFDVALKGTGNRPPPPPPPSPPEKLYDGITITPLDEGKYLVKVTVRDTSKTFTVLHLIKAEVQRLAREDFRSRHPGEPAEFIRETMRYETEAGGRILAFTGWVFSVRPVEDENNGHHYDPDSRRGCVRLRVTGGIPAAEAERWAHENIGEIVKYKNVGLEPGQAPPPGARYRSLGESFENGVLTVEFEALQ